MSEQKLATDFGTCMMRSKCGVKLMNKEKMRS